MVRVRALSVAGLILAAGCAGPSRGVGLGSGPGIGGGRLDGTSIWNRSASQTAPQTAAPAAPGAPQALPSAAPATSDADAAEVLGSTRAVGPDRVAVLRRPNPYRRLGGGLGGPAWADPVLPVTDRYPNDDALPMLSLAMNVELPAGEEPEEPFAGPYSVPARAAGNRLASFDATPVPMPFDAARVERVTRTAFIASPDVQSPPILGEFSPNGFSPTMQAQSSANDASPTMQAQAPPAEVPPTMQAQSPPADVGSASQAPSPPAGFAFSPQVQAQSGRFALSPQPQPQPVDFAVAPRPAPPPLGVASTAQPQSQPERFALAPPAVEADTLVARGDWGRPIPTDVMPEALEAETGVNVPAASAPSPRAAGASPPRRVLGRAFARTGAQGDAQSDPQIRTVEAAGEVVRVPDAPRPFRHLDVHTFVRRPDFTPDPSDSRPHRCPNCSPATGSGTPAGSGSAARPEAPSIFEVPQPSILSWRPRLLQRLRERILPASAPAAASSGRREPGDVSQGPN